MRDDWSMLKKLIWFHAVLGGGGTITTVTGTSPLTLVNALAKPIKSLVQTGKCVQSGTPTPEAPVDIVCNNGALRMVDDELPAGYKRVLGFSMKNNAYWEIPNFPMNGSDTLRFSFEATDSCNVIGAYSGSASGNNYSLYVSQSSNYLRYKNGAYNSTVDFDTRYDVEITPTGSSGMKVDSTWTAQTFTTPTNFCIGTTSVNASSAKLKGNLYGNIEVVGRAKFIPCERISDNVLGYYDLIGETFYMPTSGTPTSLGYDGSHCHLAVVGTPEVLAVSGTNIFNKADESSWGGYYVATNGKIAVSDSNLTAVIRCLPNTTYYGIHKSGRGGGRMFTVSTEEWAVGDIASEMQGSASIAANTVFSYTTQADDKWLFVCFGRSASSMPSFEEQAADFMLSLTQISAETEYVGYSGLPQTASVVDLFAVGDYKDEVDVISGTVTRRVGVKVLDGTESWQKVTAYNAYYVILDDMRYCNPTEAGFSTHFVGNGSATASMPNNTVKLSYTSGWTGAIMFKCNAYTTIADWTAFVATQYAAGTPVIVLYPLAEETTEQVTAQPMRTAEGTNTVTVTSAVAPVELKAVYLTPA